MSKMVFAIASFIAMALSVVASPASLAAKGMVECGEKVAAKAGLRVVGEGAVRGGAKLAAVTAEREVAKKAVGEAAGRVTAAHLLAAGGGAAMVVAAHECADGVQQMGEGVREAVVANPELAGRVADTVVSPARWAAAAVASAFVAFLVWFLWPWIALFRNWSRLAAARRAAEMEKAVRTSGAEASVMDVGAKPEPAQAGFTRVELIILIAGFLLLTAIGAWLMARTDKPGADNVSVEQPAAVRDDSAELESMTARRAALVARMQSDYAAALDQHYANFLSDVECVAKARFNAVRSCIPLVTERFGTLSRCKDLLADLVCDNIDDGNRTGDSIRRDLEAEFYTGLFAAHDAVEACLASFLRNAEASRQGFCRDLKVELDSIVLPGDEAFKALLLEGGDRIERCKVELAKGQIAAAISAVVEAACIRFTVSTVARLLGNAASRIAGSLVAGGGAVLADGPLPIGDIIGGVLVIGSTVWSAYDIYQQAAKALPDELDWTLRSVVDDCEAKTVAEFRKAGYDICNAYRCSND